MPALTGILESEKNFKHPRKEAFQVKVKDIEILRKREEEMARRLDRKWVGERGERVLKGGDIHYEISDRLRAIDCGPSTAVDWG